MRIMSEEELEIVAKIIGPNSVSSAVLEDMKTRRSRGEDPVCIDAGEGRLLVVDKNTTTQEEST